MDITVGERLLTEVIVVVVIEQCQVLIELRWIRTLDAIEYVSLILVKTTGELIYHIEVIIHLILSRHYFFNCEVDEILNL
jgi:hypothetical protein